MTPLEAAVVRDLQARLRLAQEDIRRIESTHRTHEEKLNRHITYLERDKAIALERARRATDQARYWQGVCVAKSRAAA